jgi:hypothetical protein
LAIATIPALEGGMVHRGRGLICLVCDDGKISYSEGDIVEVRGGMVLVRNLYIGLYTMGAEDLCVSLEKGFIIAVGRVIEAPSGVGRELVGRAILYRPRGFDNMVCIFSEGNPSEAVEIGEQEAAEPLGIIASEAQIALDYAKRSGPSPLVIGGGFLAHVAHIVLQSVGVRGYSIGRRFRGSEIQSLSLEGSIDRRYSSIYIAGIANSEELYMIERLSMIGDLRIYYHPLLKGEKIPIPLGGRISIKPLKYKTPGNTAIKIGRRIMRIARGYSYIEARIGEEPPLSGNLIIIDLKDCGKTQK